MANKIVREIIHAKGIDIGIYTKDFENEYISLTDIAKYRNDNDPRFVIQNWMRNRNTVEFLAVWEELHNPDFNRVQFEAVRSEAGLNRFVLNVALFGQTAKQWKNNNPSKKGNVRDDADLNQLLVLANMESYNAILIEQGKSQSERLVLLRNLAIKQMDTLASINLSAVSALPGGDM